MFLKMFVKKTLVALCIVAFLASGGLVYALNTLAFHQNLAVPNSGTNFSTTPTITGGSDQAALWAWDSANHRFSVTVSITNNGNSAFTPTVAYSNVPAGWTGSTSTILAIAKGASESVTLYMTSTDTNPVAGPIGDFTVTIS